MVTNECRDNIFAHDNIIIYVLTLRVLIMYNTVLLTSIAQFVFCMKRYGLCSSLHVKYPEVH